MIFIAGCGPLTARWQKKIFIDKKKKFFFSRAGGSALGWIGDGGDGTGPVIGCERRECLYRGFDWVERRQREQQKRAVE